GHWGVFWNRRDQTFTHRYHPLRSYDLAIHSVRMQRAPRQPSTRRLLHGPAPDLLSLFEDLLGMHGDGFPRGARPEVCHCALCAAVVERERSFLRSRSDIVAAVCRGGAHRKQYPHHRTNNEPCPHVTFHGLPPPVLLWAERPREKARTAPSSAHIDSPGASP